MLNNSNHFSVQGTRATAVFRLDCSLVNRRKWREGKSSPYTGKHSARPAGKPGDFLIAKEGLRRSLPRHFLRSTLKILSAQYAFLRQGGIYRSDVARPRPNPGTEPTASRWSAPCPRQKNASGGPRSSHRPR